MPEQILANPKIFEDSDKHINLPAVNSEDSNGQTPVDEAQQEVTPAGLTAPITGSLVDVPAQKLGADGPVEDKPVEAEPLDKPTAVFYDAPLEESITYRAAAHTDVAPPVALLDHVEA